MFRQNLEVYALEKYLSILKEWFIKLMIRHSTKIRIGLFLKVFVIGPYVGNVTHIQIRRRRIFSSTKKEPRTSGSMLCAYICLEPYQMKPQLYRTNHCLAK